jgi:hypothetical protein
MARPDAGITVDDPERRSRGYFFIEIGQRD